MLQTESTLVTKFEQPKILTVAEYVVHCRILKLRHTSWNPFSLLRQLIDKICPLLTLGKHPPINIGNEARIFL